MGSVKGIRKKKRKIPHGIVKKLVVCPVFRPLVNYGDERYIVSISYFRLLYNSIFYFYYYSIVYHTLYRSYLIVKVYL
jgi:hypothetical protein